MQLLLLILAGVLSILAWVFITGLIEEQPLIAAMLAVITWVLAICWIHFVLSSWVPKWFAWEGEADEEWKQ